MKACVITDLDSVCNNCGFFDGASPVNNGYGCSHEDCGDGDFIDKKGNYVERFDFIIAQSFTRRKITCNRRLAKKFIKKTRALSFEDEKKQLEKAGIKFYGKCFSFSCPIAWSVYFDELKAYENYKEYDYIKNEDDMPTWPGDELMGIVKEEADRLGIEY